jgi:hypothetical protein
MQAFMEVTTNQKRTNESEEDKRRAISKRGQRITKTRRVLSNDEYFANAVEGKEIQLKSLARKRKRPSKTNTVTDGSLQGNTKRKKCEPKLASQMTCTVEGVLKIWNDTTEYGITFRAMTVVEQQSEVQVLNKGAATKDERHHDDEAACCALQKSTGGQIARAP